MKNQPLKSLFLLLSCSFVLILYECVNPSGVNTYSPAPFSITGSPTIQEPTNGTFTDNVEGGSVELKSDNPGFDIAEIPEYSGEAYVPVNQNVPFFTDDDLGAAKISFERYSQLDSLGRCGPAIASVGTDLMPTGPRGSIGMIKPSGWHTVRYDDLVEDKYLYNRCHLIAYALTAENANPLNLITGTNFMNVHGMLPFETKVADYVRNSGNHVLYRSTPIFENENLVASGVLLEAKSAEDDGTGVMFCVYCYNVQPGIVIDYATGDSHRDDVSESDQLLDPTASTATEYIGNASSHKFHYPWCDGVKSMAEHNKVPFSTREDAIEAGYTPCGSCNP